MVNSIPEGSLGMGPSTLQIGTFLSPENMALRISPRFVHNVLVIFMHHFSLVSVKKFGPVFYNQCLKFIFLPLDSGIFDFRLFFDFGLSFSFEQHYKLDLV